MIEMEIPDRPAVRDVHPLETPCFAQELLDKSGASTAGFPVERTVGTHDCIDPCFLNSCLERWKIRFIEVLFAYHCVEGVPLRLGSAVGGQVFYATCRLEDVF